MKNLIKSKKTSGFTIIEVMIVLAIAGLIMVIVFLAVPALQRNQRDNARQSIVNRVSAELTTYAGNNQGVFPFLSTACGGTDTGKWCDFYNRYIVAGNINIKDPSTGANVFSATYVPVNIGTGACTPGNIPKTYTAGEFNVCLGARCNGESITNSGAANPQTRNYAVVLGLDRAGTVYCVDNG
jgi:prepilin-type N-terminal cleavage/methylation domain-containing protein